MQLPGTLIFVGQFVHLCCFSLLTIKTKVATFFEKIAWPNFKNLPINGIADKRPLSVEESKKSHSADGKTNDKVVELIAQVA